MAKYYDIFGNHKITGNYGEKRSYYKNGNTHQGIDLAYANNEPLLSMIDGDVLTVGNDPNGYGNYIDIFNPSMGVKVRYGHANGFDVKQGDKITAGQRIGRAGSTGRSTGSHLHAQTWHNGKLINPQEIQNIMSTEKPTFLQPKGTLPAVDNTKSIEDFAMSLVSAPKSETEKQLKEVALQNILENMQQDIKVPQATTIQDIFDAEKGDKLNVFGQYLQSPEANRFIDSFLYGSMTDDKGNLMREREGREIEARLKAEQEKAREMQKEQLGISKAVYGEENDIEQALNKLLYDAKAKQADLEAKQNQYNDTKDLKERELAEKIRHNKEMEEWHASNGGSATGGASSIDGGIGGIKMIAADRKALTENKTTLANIDAGLKSLEKNPDAYTLWKGLLGSDITNRIDSKGVATRTQIDNITAVYRKWLTGAQMSDKERKAYERFLPAPTDNYTIVKAKLEGMRGAVERSNEAILSNYGVQSAPAIPTVNKSALEAELKRRGIR